jgi:adenylate kinase
MERTSAGDKQQTWVQNRIFIEDMNSLIGSALVEEFRNDNENDFNPNIIIGNGESLPRGASKLIDAS